jgi:hypothetical protein
MKPMLARHLNRFAPSGHLILANSAHFVGAYDFHGLDPFPLRHCRADDRSPLKKRVQAVGEDGESNAGDQVGEEVPGAEEKGAACDVGRGRGATGKVDCKCRDEELRHAQEGSDAPEFVDFVESGKDERVRSAFRCSQLCATSCELATCSGGLGVAKCSKSCSPHRLEQTDPRSPAPQETTASSFRIL